jgi:hypothetical protein
MPIMTPSNDNVLDTVSNFCRNLLALALLGGSVCSLAAQSPQPDEGPPHDVFAPPGPDGDTPPPPPGGFPPGLRRGGPGFGGVREPMKLVKQFDKNGDGWLNAAERKAAREFLKNQDNGDGFGRRGGRRRPFGPPGEEQEPASPGRKLTPADVKSFPDAPLYASNVLRTFFLEFEDADWEQELAEFKNTDVEVPAKLVVDGKTYADVGVHFHGASSYFMVSEGRKRSLVLTLDYIHEGQQLGGYRKLNLLNAHEDPSFLNTVLCLEVARDYMPAPKANFARVVINSESWGVYANQEHFSQEFLKEWFGTGKGARWKVPGSPNGRGGMNYLGEDPEPYKRIYEIKSKDDPRSWTNLIRLCKALDQTRPEDVAATLGPLLDIDGVLKYMAWENVLASGDGFYTRASDYDLYQDPKGRFHVIPYDTNETFNEGHGPGGPGFGGPRFGGPPGSGGQRGPGGMGRRGRPPEGGVDLDPLVAAEDTNKPLLSKLLAVPELRARYLGYVCAIAEKWLDWNKLGPLARQYHDLIAEDVKADTRKLYSTDEFLKSLGGESGREGAGSSAQTGSLRNFAEKRRAFLLNHAEVKKASVMAKGQ